MKSSFIRLRDRLKLFTEEFPFNLSFFRSSISEVGLFPVILFYLFLFFVLVLLLPFTPFILLNEWSKCWFDSSDPEVSGDG